jgi:hypothetical protein
MTLHNLARIGQLSRTTQGPLRSSACSMRPDATLRTLPTPV